MSSLTRRSPEAVYSLTRRSQRPLFWAITIGCLKNDAPRIIDEGTLCEPILWGCGGQGGLRLERPRYRRTLPAPEDAYARLSNRIDRLEDTTSYFYNVLNELREVLNELRERVSTLEKKLKPLAKDDWIN